MFGTGALVWKDVWKSWLLPAMGEPATRADVQTRPGNFEISAAYYRRIDLLTFANEAAKIKASLHTVDEYAERRTVCSVHGDQCDAYGRNCNPVWSS